MLTRARSTVGVGVIAIISVASLSALSAPQVAAQPSANKHPTSKVSEYNALHARVAAHVNAPLAAQLGGGLGPGDLISGLGTVATFTSRCMAASKSFPLCLVYGDSAQLAQIESQLKDIQNSINALSQQSKAQYQALAAAIAAVDARVAADVERNAWNQVKDAVGRAQLGSGMYANYAACMTAVVANSNGAHNATCAKPSDAGVFPGSTIPADANAPNILLQQFIAQQDQQGCDANYAQFQQDLVGTSTDPYTLTHESGYSGPLFQYLLAGERASLGMGAGTTFAVFRPSLINKVGAAAATVRHNLDAYAAACASWADAKNPGSGQQYRDAALNGFRNGDGSTVLSMSKVLDTYAFPGWSESNPIGDGEALIAGDAMKAAMPWVTASLIKLAPAPSSQYGIHADKAATPAWNGLSATPMGSAYIPAFARDLGISGAPWSTLTKADFRANLGDGGSPVVLFRSAEGPNGTNPDNPVGRIWAAPEPLTLTNFDTSWFACGGRVCDYYFWNARTGVPSYSGSSDWPNGSQNVRIYTSMPMQGTVGQHSLMVNIYDHELPAQPAGPAIQMCAAGGTPCSFQQSGWGASYGMPYADQYLTTGWIGDSRDPRHTSDFGSIAFDRVSIGLGESWIVSDMDNGQPYNKDTIPPALNLKAAPFLAGGPLQLPSNQN